MPEDQHPEVPTPHPDTSVDGVAKRLGELLTQHRWIVFVLPLVVYMMFNSLEPPAPRPESGETATAPAGESTGWLPRIDYRFYPLVYSVKIAVTLLTMILVLPGYRQFPWRIHWLAPLVGGLGVFVWVGICALGLEPRLGHALGAEWLVELGRRSSFNPLDRLAGSPAMAYGFLAIRFVGLVAVVPVIEEFFLRGFLMRYFVDENWTQVPFATPDFKAIALVTMLAMAMHPGELLAELLWFTLVTWLMLRTRNIWDCVAAHAVTNLLLGIYVVSSGHWELM